MKVRCPHCRIRGDVADTLGGRVVRCPRCLASFRVPLVRRSEEKIEPVPVDQDRALAIGQRETTVAAADFPDLSEQNVAWEDVSADHHHRAALAGELSGVPDSRKATVDTEEKLQEELAVLLSESCSVCGKTMPDVSGAESGELGRCECREDQGADETKAPPSLVGDHGYSPAPAPPAEKLPLPGYTPDGGFRTAAILKAAWAMVAGVKGPIWGGVIVLLVVLVGVEAAATALVPFATAFGGESVAVWLQIIMQLAGAVLSLTFLAGLYTIGVRRSCGSHYSWKTVFSGFLFIGRIGLAGFLMSLLIASGFVLLILPGIYLAVGYSLALPLMVAKQYGPWEAMEASRRLIHPRWWQVFGIYIVMYLIYVLSCIPLGIGLFWTIPMLFTLTGVLYRTLESERISE